MERETFASGHTGCLFGFCAQDNHLMEFRQLGHSGVAVSVFSLGSWLTYEFMEEQDVLAVIGSGLAAGINFLDDARYDDRTGRAPMATGYSEVVFGRLLRKGGWNRADLIIANKLWFEFYPEQSPEEELEGSLLRLHMDYLDIVYCTAPPDSLPMIEMIRHIDGLITSGKLRNWGVLNWPTEKIDEAFYVAKAEGLRPPCAAQLPYSVLERFPIEDERTERICSSAGVGIVASFCLHGGLLSGKYNQAEVGASSRFGEKQVEVMRQKGLLPKVRQVMDIAREVGCTPAQLALAYCLKNNQVSSILFGAKKVTQLEENIRTLEILPRIDEEVMTRLRHLES